nr:inactive leucine-rich repeat receptor-like serine/threonine-protein kinase At1g60630 [Ipomoea batatas]
MGIGMGDRAPSPSSSSPASLTPILLRSGDSVLDNDLPLIKLDFLLDLSHSFGYSTCTMGRFSSLALLLVSFLVFLDFPAVSSGAGDGDGDGDALLALKSRVDPSGVLVGWSEKNVGSFCRWEGVKECMNGRVTKLVVERLNLSGALDGPSLSRLDQLRVLSFKDNSLSGEIPSLAALPNLKSLFLNNNFFTGGFPANLTLLHRLKVIVLSGNSLSGEIPPSLLRLSRLYVLYLQDNQFTGEIPPLNQSSLRFFNVSNNQLSGEIPNTPALTAFNQSAFSGNLELCGVQINKACPNSGPSITPSYPIIPRNEPNHRKRNRNRKLGGGEGGLGALVFCGPGDQQMNYTLEDLLKASAETLGRGTMGSTYKAVMESGYIVTVKRLRESRYPRLEEFRRHVEILGRLRHPNLVPLRAYFQAKEERLVVYDYFPNGSLFSLIHGSRASSGSKPLHWTSCLKIAEDVATGLLYIHQNPGLTHGNLKSSNVLLGSDFESCLTDYGLTPFRNPEALEESSASSLFYRAPECRDIRRPLTQQADVYSFGVLLLELLTGKTPFQDLVQEHGSDIPRWVRSVREEETESGDEPASSNEASEEKLSALLNIAMACVSLTPENRPTMRDVLKMVRDSRAEAQGSSNSSDHSPGRWSDTVQSLPRDENLSI